MYCIPHRIADFSQFWELCCCHACVRGVRTRRVGLAAWAVHVYDTPHLSQDGPRAEELLRVLCAGVEPGEVIIDRPPGSLATTFSVLFCFSTTRTHSHYLTHYLCLHSCTRARTCTQANEYTFRYAAGIHLIAERRRRIRSNSPCCVHVPQRTVPLPQRHGTHPTPSSTSWTLWT